MKRLIDNDNHDDCNDDDKNLLLAASHNSMENVLRHCCACTLVVPRSTGSENIIMIKYQ